MKAKREILFFAVACALALGAVSPALAYGQASGPCVWEGRSAEAGLGAMHWMHPGMLEDLKLTAEQREKVRALSIETFRDRRESRNGLLRDTLRDLRYGRALEPSARKDLENEMAKRMTNQIQALKNLSPILTPDQRSALLSKLDRLGTDGSNWGRRDWPERPMGRLIERLNLTEAQKTRAEVLFKSWEKPTEARREQIRRLNAEIVKQAFSPNPDSRLLEADAKKLAGLAVEGIFERSRQMEQFRSMLTDEQKKLLDEGPMRRHPGKRGW